MARVRLEGVRKIYPGKREHVAVHGIDLEIADGEFVVLVGPSGCGKSTTLRMIAGLESITSGTLMIGDRVVNDVAPKDRDVAMVFQSYALYPHMTVRRHLAFALELRGVPRDQIDTQVRRAAGTLELDELLDRKPAQLSGGQRQRVALGRALVRDPQVFLFDEPLSNLDAKLRVQMRREIARLHRELAATMIYVTHDQVEAMTLGDRIVVMDKGHVQQVDAPLALYERPVSRFVAGFIGSPAMNFLEGTIHDSMFRSDAGVDIPLGVSGSRRVILGIRPEDLSPASTGQLHGQVELAEPMGNETFLYVRVGKHELVARVEPNEAPSPGDAIDLSVNTRRVHLFDAESGRRL
jgi:multiple sugar transport system ATP-binding protein